MHPPEQRFLKLHLSLLHQGNLMMIKTQRNYLFVSSPATSSPRTSASKKEVLSAGHMEAGIMHAMNGEGDAEQQKRLTPDIWNAIVHDLVYTMYAHMSQPNKDFCTQVTKQYVGKYLC